MHSIHHIRNHFIDSFSENYFLQGNLHTNKKGAQRNKYIRVKVSQKQLFDFHQDTISLPRHILLLCGLQP